MLIWAILLTNMGHITDQYGPYYKPTPCPSPREGGFVWVCKQKFIIICTYEKNSLNLQKL